MPVCADYCSRWFEACKDDLTCYRNWLDVINNASGMPNYCPVDSSCQKFSAIFADSKDLCNRMWGTSYNYSTNTNVVDDSCTVMTFDNRMPNPNYRLTFPSSESLSTVVLGDSNLSKVGVSAIRTVAAIS